MKLITLKIHNIASIENAEIDFTRSPLSDSEVFLITGKTGAGKSTILDSISLALYGVTPRLENTNMQGSVLDNKKEFNVSRPEHILRRASGEGSVELVFEDNQGNPFQAIWSVSRAHNKPTGTLQDAKRVLRDINSGITFTKKNEINEEIKKIIGLDFSQFCRTTLLAQGEFSRFLNSKDNEKADILEKITGMSIYSRIGAKIFEIYSQKEKIFQEARDKIQNIRNLFSREEIEEINQNIKLLMDQYNSLEEKIIKENLKKDWLTQDKKLNDNLNEANIKVNHVQTQLQSPVFINEKQQVKDWDNSAEARAALTSLHQIEENISLTNENLVKFEKEYFQLVKGLNFEYQQKNIVKKELQEIEDYLEGCLQDKKTLENADTVIIHVSNFQEGLETINKENKKIIDRQKSLKSDLSIKLKQLNEEKHVIENKIKDFKTRFEEKYKDLEALKLPGLRAERDNKIQRQNSLKNLNDILLLFSESYGNYESKTKALENYRKDVKEKENKATSLARDFKIAETDFEKKNTVYESQKDTVNKFAIMMRAHLKIGDNCPVCRQVVSSDLSGRENTLRNLIEKYEADKKNAQNVLDDIRYKINKNDAELINLKDTIGNIEKELDNTWKSLQSKKNEIESSISLLNLRYNPQNDTYPFEDLKKNLPEYQNQNEHDIKIIEEKIKNGENLKREADEKRNAYDQELSKFNHKNIEIKEQEDKIAVCQSDIKASQRVIENQEQKNIITKNSLMAILAEEFKNNCLEITFVENLKKRAKEYQGKKERKASLENSLKLIEERLDNLESTQAKIIALKPQWHKISDEIVEISDLSDAFTLLLTNLNSDIVLLENLKKDMEAKKRFLDDFYTENPDFNLNKLEEVAKISSIRIETWKKDITEKEQSFTASQAALQIAIERLNEHNSHKPLLDQENDTIHKIEERISQIKEDEKNIYKTIGELNQQLETDQKNRNDFEELMKDAEAKEKEKLKWERIKILIGDAKGDRFKRIAQSYVLESLTHCANHYMNTLSGRYTLRTRPDSFLIFVEDAFQGATLRSAATLSGGETFLVSLSLALALSDIGGNLGVDTLFIDEGFGSLSGEPLQNAISTLRSLHSATGKHVGIISHVEELREKIPVQIHVERESNNSSSRIRVTP